jgi:hypothetical protein
MNTQEVAQRLVELVRQGKSNVAFEELYDENIVSTEGDGTTIHGIQAVLQHSQDFQSQIEEFHGMEVSDPIVAETHFAVTMVVDATYKGGHHKVLNEICVYEVQNGKVIKEQFFFPV